MYAWGASSKEDLTETARRLGVSDCVAIHVNDLRDAFRQAAGVYFAEVGESDERVGNVLKNAGTWLINMDQAIVRAFLDRTSLQADA
jgi:hypothetical protein